MQSTQTNQSPGILAALGQHLELIRQEQLAKNRSTLRTLAAEQQKHVELLTLAITRKVFEEVIQEWRLSIIEGNETQISEIISLIWGSLRDPAEISRRSAIIELHPE